MVKFSKQFEGQLVPEWKEAFVDYSSLKKDIKWIQQTHHNHNKPPPPPPTLLQRVLSPFITTIANLPAIGRRREEGATAASGASSAVIQVHRKLASCGSREDLYETEILQQFAGAGAGDGGAAGEFFKKLDGELNKVNRFYKGKEKELLKTWESLKTQMDILVDLKAELLQLQQQRRRLRRRSSSSSTINEEDEEEDSSISYLVTCGDDNEPPKEELRAKVDEEDEEEDHGGAAIGSTDPEELAGTDRIGSLTTLEGTKRCLLQQHQQSVVGRKTTISCRGKNLRVSIPLTTPTRTISALGYLVFEELLSPSSRKKKNNTNNNNELSVNKKMLRRAEKMIRGAFVELYKGLGYLNTYRTLNMQAFAKILKKFDKFTGKQVLTTYLRVVESSYFNSSDKAVKLMDVVEELFIKHLAEDDRRKAMKYLKPHHREESHAITFFIGLFTGCFVALFAGYCLLARVVGMYTSGLDSVYMETAYPVLSMFGLLFLHLFVYGCDVYVWRRTRINHTFIFESKPSAAELKFRDVFFICASSMTVVVGFMVAHLVLIAKGYPPTQVQGIPAILLLMFFLVLVCPFDVAYRSSRYHFLRVIRNIISSPLYKVVMVDFFMADQLCSQIPMLRNLEYVACYYITGSYRTQDYSYCTTTSHYRDLAYAVSFLPYYWRAMQCARRWFDEGDMDHLVNLGKYVSAMLAAGAKVAYEKERSAAFLALLVAVSSAATLYQLYWDFVKDWGFFQPNSKNPCLRNNLVLRRKSIYFISMGLNLVLRLAWVQSVLHYNLGDLDYRVTSFFLAALEVIRRGHWNFYRLENEHLNNAGKFRAVKAVPLPFHEVDGGGRG